MFRGNQRQIIFLDDGDRVRFLSLVSHDLKPKHFRLYAFVLMPNHVHLLLKQLSDYSLSRYMHRLLTTYTGFFNHKHHRVGHVFQGRFKSIVVDQNSHLLEVIRYIHLNPARARIEAAPGSYPWSSHLRYLKDDKKVCPFVEPNEILRLFGKNKPEARRAYIAFLKEVPPTATRDRVAPPNDQRILGNPSFQDKVRSLSRDTLSVSERATIPQIWAVLRSEQGINDEIRRRIHSRLRAEAAYIAYEWFHHPLKDVAAHLGVSPEALSMGIRRLEECWKKGKGSQEDLRQRIRRLLPC